MRRNEAGFFGRRSNARGCSNGQRVVEGKERLILEKGFGRSYYFDSFRLGNRSTKTGIPRGSRQVNTRLFYVSKTRN